MGEYSHVDGIRRQRKWKFQQKAILVYRIPIHLESTSRQCHSNLFAKKSVGDKRRSSGHSGGGSDSSIALG